MNDLPLLLIGIIVMLVLFAVGGWLCDNVGARDARRRNHARRIR